MKSCIATFLAVTDDGGSSNFGVDGDGSTLLLVMMSDDLIDHDAFVGNLDGFADEVDVDECFPVVGVGDVPGVASVGEPM